MDLENLIQEFKHKMVLDPAGVPILQHDLEDELEHQKIMSLLSQYENEIEMYSQLEEEVSAAAIP